MAKHMRYIFLHISSRPIQTDNDVNKPSFEYFVRMNAQLILRIVFWNLTLAFRI